MFEEERKIHILNILNRDKSTTINALASFFHVSPSTIRRDLTSMEESDLIKRTHGGAILLESTERNYNFEQKQSKDFELKDAIGKAAAALVQDGDIIALNSSTITTQMARHLNAKGITLVTNSLNILNIVKDYQDCQIVVLGGIYMTNAQTIEGPTTTEQIQQMHFDKVFLGANGVDFDFGLSSASELEARGKIAMMNQAKRTYFLCEHAKFDHSALFRVAELKSVSAIVTDWLISPETLERYQNGVDIIVADKN